MLLRFWWYIIYYISTIFYLFCNSLLFFTIFDFFVLIMPPRPVCSVCSLSFSSNNQFKAHLCLPRRNSDSSAPLLGLKRPISDTFSPPEKKLHVCPLCKDSFSSKKDLARHLRSDDHLGEIPAAATLSRLGLVSCTTCQKVFTTLSSHRAGASTCIIPSTPDQLS